MSLKYITVRPAHLDKAFIHLKGSSYQNSHIDLILRSLGIDPNLPNVRELVVRMVSDYKRYLSDCGADGHKLLIEDEIRVKEPYSEATLCMTFAKAWLKEARVVIPTIDYSSLFEFFGYLGYLVIDEAKPKPRQ